MTFNIMEVDNWSDEQCDSFDKGIDKVSGRCLRVTVKTLKKLNAQNENWREIVETLWSGNLKGYAIKCPHCGVKYIIDYNELNRHNTITCMDCGHSYYQPNCIVGITSFEDNNG